MCLREKGCSNMKCLVRAQAAEVIAAMSRRLRCVPAHLFLTHSFSHLTIPVSQGSPGRACCGAAGLFPASRPVRAGHSRATRVLQVSLSATHNTHPFHGATSCVRTFSMDTLVNVSESSPQHSAAAGVTARPASAGDRSASAGHGRTGLGQYLPAIQPSAGPFAGPFVADATARA